MCAPFDSHPPIQAIAGAAVTHEQLVLEAADGNGLAAAVGCHGSPAERNGQPGPTQVAGTLQAPILALMAGADEHITAPMVAELDAALAAAGVEHEVVTYPGAPHSFFDRRYEE